MKRVFIAIVAAVLAAAGCASVQNVPLSTEAARKLQGMQLAQTRYEKPDFQAITSSRGMFGVLGVGAMISEGNKLVADHGIQDPALQISDSIARSLGERLKLRPPPAVASQSKSDNVTELAKQYQPAEVLLDVRTLGWGFVHFSTDFSHYRLMYNFRLRLIDAKASTVLAERNCIPPDEKPANPPTHDEMLANGAAWLKQQFAAVAARCADQFRRETLLL